MYKLPASNLQYVTSITFLLSTYGKYMAAKQFTFNCGNLVVTSRTLRSLAKSQVSNPFGSQVPKKIRKTSLNSHPFLHFCVLVQVDYILGDNPLKMSYMVGYGLNYPRKIHHRGSSLPSKASHPQSIGCDGGFQPFYYSGDPNPNILTGAVVGGPDQNDKYSDDRSDYSHSEPATYINAALVGPLAYLSKRSG